MPTLDGRSGQGASVRGRAGRGVRGRAVAPARSRALLVAAVIALLALPALAGCGGDDDGTETFEHPSFALTFEYPSELELDESPDFEVELGEAAEDNVALGLDEDNALILQRFALTVQIDEENLDLAKRELDGLLAEVDPEAADGVEGEIAAFPALAYDGVTLPAPAEAESDYVALFDDDVQYMVNCQSTPERREEIDEACEQALTTLRPAAPGDGA